MLTEIIGPLNQSFPHLLDVFGQVGALVLPMPETLFFHIFAWWLLPIQMSAHFLNEILSDLRQSLKINKNILRRKCCKSSYCASHTNSNVLD